MTPTEERLAALLKSATPEPPAPVSFEAVRERVARHPVLVTEAPTRPARTWGVSLATAAAVLVMLLSVGLVAVHGRNRPELKPQPVATIDIGYHLAYLNRGNVWFDGRQVTNDGNDNWPRVRPGGDAVVYSHGTQLWVVSTRPDASPRLLADPGIIGRPAWSPDGTQLAYLDAGGLLVAGYADGVLSGVHRVTDAGPARVEGTSWLALLRRTGAVAWSPDGHYLAHTGGACTATWASCVSLLDLATGTDRPLTGVSGVGDSLVNLPAFGADSRTLYLTVGREQPPAGKAEGTALRVVSCLIDVGCDTDHQTQVGQDGDTVASPSPQSGSDTVLVTGAWHGHSWLTELRIGSRSNLYQGYGQDWAP